MLDHVKREVIEAAEAPDSNREQHGDFQTGMLKQQEQ